ncbi:MAG: ABC transporter ATP-binding protein [Lentisphaerae bacterium]|nr:ABC transporter ATP-binding protein [Lentisphaerota bacterium]
MWETVNRMRVIFSSRDKYFLIFLTLLTALSALWEVTGIGLMIPVVAAVVNWDLMEQNMFLKLFYQLSPFKEHNSFMIFTAALVVVNYALKNLFNYYVLRLQCKFIYRKQHDLSVRLFRGFLESDYLFLTSRTPGEFSAGIQRVNLACEGTLLPLMLICGDAVVVAALVMALLWFMPLYLTGAMIILLVMAWFFYLPFRRINSAMSEEYIQYDNQVAADKIEVFSGCKTIKSCECNDFFVRRFSRKQQQLLDVARRMYIWGQLPRLGLELLAVALAMGIFMAMIGSGVPAGTVVLNFALLVAAIGRILPALSRIQYNLTRVRQVEKIFGSIYEDLTAVKPESTPETPGNELKDVLQQAIEIRDLDFAYPDGRKVFEQFSLTVPAFTSVALIGPTGGGKTTLADLMTGLLKPSGGTIAFDGVNIESDLKAIRKKISYVPQKVFLLASSIRENVALGVEPDKIDDQRLEQALQMAHLSDWIASLPDGVDTLVGCDGGRLSGGQLQRIGIARALYHEAELLIFDEATSALDNATENAVVEALETLHGRKTMVVIAHRMSSVEHCDQVIEIGKSTT